MTLTLKIFGGTLPDKHICDVCDRAQNMVDNHGQPITYCRALGYTIKDKIVRCSNYRPLDEDSVNFRLATQAWKIDLDVDGKTVQFTTPQRKRLQFKNGKLVERKSQYRRRRVTVMSRPNPGRVN